MRFSPDNTIFLFQDATLRPCAVLLRTIRLPMKITATSILVSLFLLTSGSLLAQQTFPLYSGNIPDSQPSAVQEYLNEIIPISAILRIEEFGL